MREKRLQEREETIRERSGYKRREAVIREKISGYKRREAVIREEWRL